MAIHGLGSIDRNARSTLRKIDDALDLFGRSWLKT